MSFISSAHIYLLYFKCAQAVRSAFKVVDVMMAAGNWSQLSTDFQSCLPLSLGLDAFQFVSNLADVFMSTVQYNNEAPSFNVENICEVMLVPGDVYRNLIKIVYVRSVLLN